VPFYPFISGKIKKPNFPKALFPSAARLSLAYRRPAAFRPFHEGLALSGIIVKYIWLKPYHVSKNGFMIYLIVKRNYQMYDSLSADCNNIFDCPILHFI
jgi:hypothetical protein